jgi:hypothetical protein
MYYGFRTLREKYDESMKINTSIRYANYVNRQCDEFERLSILLITPDGQGTPGEAYDGPNIPSRQSVSKPY